MPEDAWSTRFNDTREARDRRPLLCVRRPQSARACLQSSTAAPDTLNRMDDSNCVTERERESEREREKPSHLRSIISHRLIEICNNLESTKNSKPRAIPRPFDSLKTRQFLTWRDSWGFCLEMTKARRRIWIPHLLHLEGAFSLAQLCSPS